MEHNNADFQAIDYVHKRRRRKTWQKVVSALATVVVFVTTYALIIPVLTKSTETFCGLEEHIHTQECFEEQKVLICEPTEGHKHTAECYEEEVSLSCTVEETEGHKHTDECYGEAEVCICGIEEGEENPDNPEEGVHTHSESCYMTELKLICTKEEIEPHKHTEDCYTKTEKLVCGETEQEAHVHTEECYSVNEVCICGKEEHIHTAICYSNPKADVEGPSDWEKMFMSVELSGDRAADLVTVAQTQLGYSESENNYYVKENGRESGYTRYGGWGNKPYDDWGMLFCSFCCKYAEVDTEYLTNPEYCDDWITVLKDNNLFFENGYKPQTGDIVFLADKKDDDGNTVTENRAGIIKSVITGENGEETKLFVIEGNRAGRVEVFDIDCTDSEIEGYCKIPVNPEQQFTLSAETNDKVTFTVSGSRSAFEYPVECLSLSVAPVKNSKADEMICDAVANLGSEEYRYSIIENLLYDISIIYTDPKTGSKKEVEPCGSLELSLSGINKDKTAESVKIYHINDENGTADALVSDYENGCVSTVTDSFSVYGVSLLAASGSAITSLSSISTSGTYYLSQNITVNNPVNVSGNSTLDLNGYKITVNCNPAIRVSGGTLTITDSASPTVTTQRTAGTEFGKTASYNNGTLTYYITETQVVDSSTGRTEETLVKYTVSNAGIIAGNKNGRAIEITNGGTLNFNGGYICNFKNDNGGAVYVSGNDSKLNLNGGVIAANSSNKGGGVYLNGYSTLNITSGAITGNEATSEGGGGVYAVSYWQYATINMSGGYITNNLASSNDYWNGGGGVQLERLAKLLLSGEGRITSNKTLGGGGGVKTRQDWGNNESGRVEMTGGYITANNATGAEGGGVNINAGGSMNMKAGHITNNIAGTGKNDGTFQHWGGGGLFCSENSSSIVIMNSLITENSAGGFGGGVAGCSTGRIVTATDCGTGIFENEALGEHLSGSGSTKNEDHTYAASNEVFMSHGYQDYFCALSSNISGGMLAGGPARWEGSTDGVPVTTDSVDDVVIGSSVTGLTCNAEEADKENARAAATSFFNGNESPTHGGGILANGYLILGNTDRVEVFARLEITGLRKRFLTQDGTEISQTPGEFEFVVVDEYGETVAHAFNSQDGSLNLDRRLPFTSAGTFTYYLYEVQPEDGSIQHDTSRYKIVVTVTADNSVGNVPWTDIRRIQYKFTNIKTTEMTSNTVFYNADPGNDEAHAVSVAVIGSKTFDNWSIESGDEPGGSGTGGQASDIDIYVSVKKVWEGNTQGPSSVAVTLLKDGVASGSATLNSGNNWSYTWSGLQPGADYTVTEEAVSGYVADYDFTYTYDTETVIGDSDNGAITYKLSGNYYVPVSSSDSLSSTGKYIISSPDGAKLLMITSAHADAALTSADTYSATRDSQNRYKASDIPDSCIFTYYATNNGGYNFSSLKNSGVWSFLLVQQVGDTYLKGTNGESWSSPARLNGGKLQGQLCPDSWQSGNPWRYVIWDGSKFDTATSISRITYEVMSASHKNYTITNTPENQAEYSLVIRKCEKDNEEHVIPGAIFELRNGNTPLRFSETSNGCYTYNANGNVTRLTTTTSGYIRIFGLRAGTYTLSEVLPPYGYIATQDRTVTLGADTPDRSLEIRVENEKFVLVLPQTGGTGTAPIYTFGVILCVGALMCGIRGRRRRKEVE